MRTLLVFSGLIAYAMGAFGIPGGYSKQTAPYSKHVEDLATFAMAKYAQSNNQLGAWDKTFTLKDVQTQVVSGLNYKLTLAANLGGQDYTCQFVVFEQAWTHTQQVSHSDCQPTTKRQLGGQPLLGGVSAVNCQDTGLLDAVDFVLDKINAMSNSMYKFTQSDLTHCTKQVVAGMKYSADITVQESACMQMDKTKASHCAAKNGGMVEHFHFSVVEQSWMPDKYQYVQINPIKKKTEDKENQSDVLKYQESIDRVSNVASHAGELISYFLGDNDKVLKKGSDFVKNFMSKDGKDLTQHGKELLDQLAGKDKNELKSNGAEILKKLLGGDGHDLIAHGKNVLLGGDGHDLQPHGKTAQKPLIGGDGHDLKPHGKPLIGGDGHDLLPHGETKKPLIGGDGHDLCHRGMFEDFKRKQNKLYESEKEEAKRFNIFCDNMKTAKMLQDSEKGTARYGATMFADMTEKEFKQYVGKPWDLNGNDGMDKAVIPKGNIPESFDWRDHNAVTEVKNQGSCGSCWAFSTTGNIEGQWAIKKKKLVSLSEQELVDCDKVDEGCNGGLPSNAYKEIIRLGGLETESEYKYEGKDEKCHFVKSEARVKINGSVSISQNETEMAAWLAKNGPISIGINAFAMQFYMGGISHPWKIFCNPKNLDHGVLIVGYGVDNGKPYWIVKNSWGPGWGEKGYYLVYRGAGVCGLNTMCTSAVVN